MDPAWVYSDVPTPIGTFRIVYQGDRVRVIDLLERGLEQAGTPEGTVRRRPPFPKGSPPHQLSEFFHRRRDAFEVTLDLDGSSEFDRSVWTELVRIPAGATVTYGELARRSGHPGAARAVGGAMHRNPIPIVVPCHRVVGDAGSLTGYGLGLWRKRWLLDREGAWPLRAGTVDGPPHPRGQRTLDHHRAYAHARRGTAPRTRRNVYPA